MCIAKLKDGPKRVKKTFSMILESVFEMVWWRGRKWNHIKKNFWSWSVFLLSKYWLPHLFQEALGAFLFPSVIFYMLRLRGFDDIWGENHFFKNLFSDGSTWNVMVMTMDIPAVDAYSGMELCTAIWLNHDYGDGRVVDILAVDTYSGRAVCTTIFLGEASKYFFLGSKSFLKKNQNSNGHIP
jgi:hypothetical protein